MAAVPHDAYPYEATRDITIGGVRAYAAGDPVPADAVEQLGLLADGTVTDRPDPEPEQPAESAVKPRARGGKTKADDTATKDDAPAE